MRRHGGPGRAEAADLSSFPPQSMAHRPPFPSVEDFPLPPAILIGRPTHDRANPQDMQQADLAWQNRPPAYFNPGKWAPMPAALIGEPQGVRTILDAPIISQVAVDDVTG